MSREIIRLMQRWLMVDSLLLVAAVAAFLRSGDVRWWLVYVLAASLTALVMLVLPMAAARRDKPDNGQRRQDS